MTTKGFIYVRTHSEYENHEVCKLGSTINIPSRDSQYATGEYERGRFTLVIEITDTKDTLVEKLLQNYFKCKGYYRKSTGGREFFSCEIANLVIPFLNSTNIIYRQISPSDVVKLERLAFIKEQVSKLKIFKGIKERRSPKNWLLEPNSSEQQMILTVISKKYTKPNIPDSKKDYEEQMDRLKKGDQLVWDDTPKNGANENDIFIFVHNGNRLEVYRIMNVLPANHRLITWKQNTGHEKRNVLCLTSRSVHIPINDIPSMSGRIVRGTVVSRDPQVRLEIMTYLKTH